MAQAKLWPRHPIRYALTVAALAMLAPSCRADEKAIGMTLLFQSAGNPVGVLRFDPDGLRGPVPGAVGGIYPRGGKEMAFMPGDGKRGIPEFVDIGWVVPTLEYEEWSRKNRLKSKAEQYSEEGRDEYKREWAKNPNYTKRIDFTSIITPELVAQVRANAQTTQLKLTITFKSTIQSCLV